MLEDHLTQAPQRERSGIYTPKLATLRDPAAQRFFAVKLWALVRASSLRRNHPSQGARVSRPSLSRAWLTAGSGAAPVNCPGPGGHGQHWVLRAVHREGRGCRGVKKNQV